jgi:hypothetical protein
MLAGANDLRAIFRWGRRLKPEALKLLGIEDGKKSAEVAYIVTSLPAAVAGPERLLALSRAHWAGARALAALRNLVLWLIRSRGLSVPEARENFREDRAEALALVTGRNL